VQALCNRAIGLLAPAARQHNVNVETDFPATDLVIQADGQRLEQVFLNLLQNAIEAVGSRKGGTVMVRARREPLSVFVEVEDDGPGLPSGDAPLFDAFFSTKPNGTGLGLAIVHRIVTDHGGTIDVERRAERTLFRVRLPLGPNDSREPDA
jgi:signal transduction histidine kinase